LLAFYAYLCNNLGFTYGLNMSTPTYIDVSAEVRYWEDATINGQEDSDGKLTPLRSGKNWCPVIRLADGLVMGWPADTKADIHFKVCDQGEYWLLDENRQRIAKWSGYYVPNDFLCHGDQGYGDYIIFTVQESGAIKSFKKPEIVWVCACDDDEEHEGSGWKRLKATGQSNDSQK